MAQSSPRSGTRARYDLLDRIPESLYAAVATHTHGSLPDRAEAVLVFRRYLLAGQLPPRLELQWPAPACRDALLDELQDIEIAGLCRDQESLADSLILTVLQAVARHDRVSDESLGEHLSGLEAREMRRMEEAALLEAVRSGTRADRDGAAGEGRAPDRGKLRHQAMEAAGAQAVAAARVLVRERWGPWARLWTDVARVLNDLDRLIGRRRDITRFVLQDPQWHDIDRLRTLHRKRRAIHGQLKTLSRMQLSAARASEPGGASRILAGVPREDFGRLEIRRRAQKGAEERPPARSPLDRLLPHMARIPGHPTLKRLHLAQRARGAVRTGWTGSEFDLDTQDGGTDTATTSGSRRKRPGPVLVCLCMARPDNDVASRVARAVALEALRLAELEGRPCWGFVTIEADSPRPFPLGLDPRTITTLLEFLSLEPPGEARPLAPLRQVLAAIDEHAWRRADLVLVADTDPRLGPIEKRLISDSRAYSALRVHGVLVGSRAEVLAPFCDTAYRASSWSALEKGR